MNIRLHFLCLVHLSQSLPWEPRNSSKLESGTRLVFVQIKQKRTSAANPICRQTCQCQVLSYDWSFHIVDELSNKSKTTSRSCCLATLKSLDIFAWVCVHSVYIYIYLETMCIHVDLSSQYSMSVHHSLEYFPKLENLEIRLILCRFHW